MTKVAVTYRMTMVDGEIITFDAPSRLNLPRNLKGRGIQNYEPISTAAFLSACEATPGTVFDIGANIGLYSLAAYTGLRKRVVAFEPFRPAAVVLRSIADKYSYDIEVINAAVADQVGETEFYISSRSDMSNSLNKDFRFHRHMKLIKTITIDARSRRYRPSIIKIDTETTEMQVLQGSIETISRDRPYILLEILNKVQLKTIRDFFSPYDYSGFSLGNPELLDRLIDISDLERKGDRRNWMFVPETVTDELIGRMNKWLARLKDLPVAQ